MIWKEYLYGIGLFEINAFITTSYDPEFKLYTGIEKVLIEDSKTPNSPDLSFERINCTLL